MSVSLYGDKIVIAGLDFVDDEREELKTIIWPPSRLGIRENEKRRFGEERERLNCKNSGGGVSMWETDAWGWCLVEMCIGAPVPERAPRGSESPFWVSFPPFIFRAITRLAWNQPWREYFYHRNQQMITNQSFPPFCFVSLQTQFTSIPLFGWHWQVCAS